MRSAVLLAAFVFTAMMAVLPLGHAQDADRVTCFSLESENYKEKDKFAPGEEACSRMIASGKFGGKGLAAIHRARGSWRQKKGALDAALADYAIAIKIEPKNVESFDYRADVYQQKGDLDRALADYDRVSKIDPLYAAAHFSRGMIFEKKKDLDKARDEYNTAIKLPTKDRIAQWAQDNARARLKALDEQPKEEPKK